MTTNDLNKKIEDALKEKYGGVDLTEAERVIFDKTKISNEGILNEIKKLLGHAKTYTKQGATSDTNVLKALTDLQVARWQSIDKDGRKAYVQVNSVSTLAKSAIDKLFEFADKDQTLAWAVSVFPTQVASFNSLTKKEDIRYVASAKNLLRRFEGGDNSKSLLATLKLISTTHKEGVAYKVLKTEIDRAIERIEYNNQSTIEKTAKIKAKKAEVNALEQKIIQKQGEIRDKEAELNTFLTDNREAIENSKVNEAVARRKFDKLFDLIVSNGTNERPSGPLLLSLSNVFNWYVAKFEKTINAETFSDTCVFEKTTFVDPKYKIIKNETIWSSAYYLYNSISQWDKQKLYTFLNEKITSQNDREKAKVAFETMLECQIIFKNFHREAVEKRNQLGISPSEAASRIDSLSTLPLEKRGKVLEYYNWQFTERIDKMFEESVSSEITSMVALADFVRIVLPKSSIDNNPLIGPESNYNAAGAVSPTKFDVFWLTTKPSGNIWLHPFSEEVENSGEAMVGFSTWQETIKFFYENIELIDDVAPLEIKKYVSGTSDGNASDLEIKLPGFLCHDSFLRPRSWVEVGKDSFFELIKKIVNENSTLDRYGQKNDIVVDDTNEEKWKKYSNQVFAQLVGSYSSLLSKKAVDNAFKFGVEADPNTNARKVNFLSVYNDKENIEGIYSRISQPLVNLVREAGSELSSARAKATAYSSQERDFNNEVVQLQAELATFKSQKRAGNAELDLLKGLDLVGLKKRFNKIYGDGPGSGTSPKRYFIEDVSQMRWYMDKIEELRLDSDFTGKKLALERLERESNEKDFERSLQKLVGHYSGKTIEEKISNSSEEIIQPIIDEAEKYLDEWRKTFYLGPLAKDWAKEIKRYQGEKKNIDNSAIIKEIEDEPIFVSHEEDEHDTPPTPRPDNGNGDGDIAEGFWAKYVKPRYYQGIWIPGIIALGVVAWYFWDNIVEWWNGPAEEEGFNEDDNKGTKAKTKKS